LNAVPIGNLDPHTADDGFSMLLKLARVTGLAAEPSEWFYLIGRRPDRKRPLMRLTAIPLVTALLPVLAVHVCYLLAASQGHVSWCFPYFPDCVSISATGRHPPESILFRTAIIPTSVLMMDYWKLSLEWLKALGTRTPRLNGAMMGIGMVAAVGLFLYSSVLGEVGELFRQQRRIGMILFYIFTFLAQLLMTVQVAAVVGRGGATVPRPVFRGLLACSGLVATLGAMSLLSWAFYDDYRRYEDAFEWVITLLILVHTFVTYFAWRQSGFRAGFTVSGSAGSKDGPTP